MKVIEINTIIQNKHLKVTIQTLICVLNSDMVIYSYNFLSAIFFSKNFELEPNFFAFCQYSTATSA